MLLRLLQRSLESLVNISLIAADLTLTGPYVRFSGLNSHATLLLKPLAVGGAAANCCGSVETSKMVRNHLRDTVDNVVLTGCADLVHSHRAAD